MIFMWYYVGSCAIQNFVKIGNLKGFPNRPFWAKNKRRESYRSYTHIGISKKCIQYCTAFLKSVIFCLSTNVDVSNTILFELYSHLFSLICVGLGLGMGWGGVGVDRWECLGMWGVLISDGSQIFPRRMQEQYIQNVLSPWDRQEVRSYGIQN